MKKSKKLITLFAVMILSIGILSACTSSPSSSTPEARKASTTQADTSAENDNGEIVFSSGAANYKLANEVLISDIISDKTSEINVSLLSSTTLTGNINADNKLTVVSISLDSSSVWNVTADSYVKSISDLDSSLSNIKDGGNTIYYDASNGKNKWINGKTVDLAQGGKLVPIK